MPTRDNFNSGSKTTIRRAKGSLGSLMLAASIPICFAIGAFALDLAHFATVRGELQKAVDAAALAGAADLLTAPNSCDADALTVASLNTADGRAVSNLSTDTAVTVSVTPCTQETAGEVAVTASMKVDHMFATIFGHPSDYASATGTAGSGGTLVQLAWGQAFPLAVSIDTVCDGPGNSSSSSGGGSSGGSSSGSGSSSSSSGGSSCGGSSDSGSSGSSSGSGSSGSSSGGSSCGGSSGSSGSGSSDSHGNSGSGHGH